MGVGRWEGRRNLCYPSWLWKNRVFLEHSLALESRGEAQAPRFVSWREAVLGDGPAKPFHPLLQLGCLGEIMTHGEGRGKGGAGWITLPWWGRALYPWLWGLTEGLVGLLFMEMGKRSAGWPVEDGSPSTWGWRVGEELGELSGWWWEMCNTDAYLLTAACQERRSSAPGSHLKSQAVSSGHILSWLQPYWTSMKSSILSWRAWWYSSPAPQAGPGGGMQQRSRTSPRGAQGRGNRDRDDDLRQPKRTAITRKSTTWNATDPLVLTSRTHLKLLSSPGTNCCCTLFNREKRDF